MNWNLFYIICFLIGCLIGNFLFKNEKLVPVKVLTVGETSTILETVDEHYRFEISGTNWGMVGDNFKVKESEID